MSWFRCDDALASHPKVMALDDKLLPAMGLWVLCGVYCSKHLTDGFVPRKVVRMYRGERLARLLEAAGLFKPAPDGWILHDYLDWNPSRVQVLKKRSTRQAAGQAGGLAKARASARANGQANDVAKPYPVPVPSPVPEILSDVLGKGSAREPWIDPVVLYGERAKRKKLSTKEADWIEDLHVRFSRTEVVRALYAVEPGTDYLKRVDAFLEGAA